jgi:ribosomal protein L24E
MPEIAECSSCGSNVDQHGLTRYLEWDGVRHAFCSFLCEFFWRRRRDPDHVLAGVASAPYSLSR